MSRIKDVEHDMKLMHQKYGLGMSSKLMSLSEEAKEFRIRMVKEESREFVDALESGDLIAIAREGIDLVMIAVGTLLMMGIPFWGVWRIVMDCNMKKLRATGNTKAAKPIKPKGWLSPDKGIAALLGLDPNDRIKQAPLPEPKKAEVPAKPPIEPKKVEVPPIEPKKAEVPPDEPDPVASSEPKE